MQHGCVRQARPASGCESNRSTGCLILGIWGVILRIWSLRNGAFINLWFPLATKKAGNFKKTAPMVCCFKCGFPFTARGSRKSKKHRCPFWLFCSKHRWQFLVYLVVESSTRATHLFPLKGHLCQKVLFDVPKLPHSARWIQPRCQGGQ